MENDADFESHGIETDSRPVSKKRRKKQKDPLKISEEEALLRLEKDLAKVKGEFGGDEDLEEDDAEDDADESEEGKKSVAKKSDAEGRATAEGEILVRRDRPKVVTIKELSRHIRDLARSLYGEELGEQEEWLAKNRPRKRGECPEFRPCPFLSCRYHLYLDITRYKGIKFNFPDVDPAEMPFSCSLDIAEEGGRTLDAVAALLNMTREMVRQVEARAIKRSLETVKDSSRKLPDGSYMKWEDVEEYEDGGEGDGGLELKGGNGKGLGKEKRVGVLREDICVSQGGEDSQGGGEEAISSDKEANPVQPAIPTLDFSLDDEE